MHSLKLEKRIATDLEAMRRLHEIATMCTRGENDLNKCLKAILDAAIAFTGAEKGNIQLLDGKSDALKIVAQRGFAKPFLKFFAIVRSKEAAACGAAMKAAERVMIEDVTQSPIFKGQPSLKALLKEGVRAVQSTPLLSSTGKLLGMMSTHFRQRHRLGEREMYLIDVLTRQAADYLERKRIEQRLAEQARLLNLSHDAIIVRDPQNRIVYWNKGAEEIYGYTREEAAGTLAHNLLRTKHPKSVAGILKKLHRNDRWSGELVHTRKDGRQITVFSRWSLDRDALGRPALILETNNDITARKYAEDEVQRSKELLKKRVRDRTRDLGIANKELKIEIERRKGLEGEILSVSDREQQRLGRELHDGICQYLTAIAFMARSVALRLKNHRVIDVADIEKIAELVNNAAVDTRNLSRALHRIDVDAADLVDALEDLVDREIWTTPCRLEVKPSFRIEDDIAAAQLYRIAREAVINANKHAQARKIVVKLERVGNEMVLRVIDDGVGFMKTPKLKQGLGSHIMNYRAQLIGGRLEIDSPKRGGTSISCYLPDGALQPYKSRGKSANKSDSQLKSRKRPKRRT